MVLPRRSVPVGWDDTAFQLWDRMPVWSPLNIPAVPLLGRYGEDYMPALPFVVLKLPPSVTTVFPNEVHGALGSRDADAGDGGDDSPVFLVLVHPALEAAEDDVTDDVNLILHPWALPHLKNLETPSEYAKPNVGAFPVVGASPLYVALAKQLAAGLDPLSPRSSVKDASSPRSPASPRSPISPRSGRQATTFREMALGGVAFGRLRTAQVFVHNGREATSFREMALGGVAFGKLRTAQVFVHNGCLSPDNLKLRVCCDGCRLSAFFSAATLGSRSVSTLHIVPSDEESEDVLREAVALSPDVEELRRLLPAAITSLGSEGVAELLAEVLDGLLVSPGAAAYGQGAADEASPSASAGGTSPVSPRSRRLRFEVNDPKGRPLKGAVVELITPQGQRIGRAVTDSSGVARCGSVPGKQKFELRVVNKGYNKFSQSVK